MEQQFIDAINANPIEATTHHAYADWLSENGRDDEAAFRRSMGNWFQSDSWGDQDKGLMAQRPNTYEPRHEPSLQPWRVHEDHFPEGAKPHPENMPGGSYWPETRRFGFDTYQNMEDYLHGLFMENLRRERQKRMKRMAMTRARLWKM